MTGPRLAGAVVLALGVALGAPGPLRADDLPASETAAVLEARAWSVGVFEPLRIGLGRGVELDAHPLAFFVSPNAVVRVSHWLSGPWQLTGAYGLSAPTLAMKLLQGYLFPSWENGEGRLGFWIVPRVGLTLSRELPRGDVVTLHADAAMGVSFTEEDLEPLDAPALLDLLFAPVTRGFRAGAGARYDAVLRPWLRATVALDAFVPRFTLRGELSLSLRLSRQSRLSLGALWWSYDSHASGGRSNDLLPVIDYVWTSR